jgi:hypothetical protein
MKLIGSIFIFSSLWLVSCSSGQNKEITKDGNAQSSDEVSHIPASVPDAVVIHYLDIKNALAADNSDVAAEAGGKLYKDLVSLKPDNLNDIQKKVLADISVNVQENAERISKSAGNIKHQREHFRELSDEIYSFVKVFGSSETLYKDYCPMAKANWVSEVKEMENPYYGGEMPDCGEIKETINPQ